MPEFNKLTATSIKEATKELTDKHAALIVITNNPLGSLSMVRKHWLHLIRRIENERAATLNPTKRLDLKEEIDAMSNLPFTIRTPAPDDWGVFFMEPDETWKIWTQLGLKTKEANWLPAEIG
ncbi:MAG TPA: hypothetical protein VNX65_03475 [Patescibacteria group bacterium]|nr:hypothetical protein [Patescibacteria group bacterium]